MSDTDNDREDRVRRRAYELWEAAGRPEGQGDEFWRGAWAEITGEAEQDRRTELGASAIEPETSAKSQRSGPDKQGA